MQDNGQGSLASRAQTRRQELLKRKTTTIEVPGLEGILAMEYRALSYAEGRRITSRHERQRDDALREIYVAADQLIQASVQAHEINPDGTLTALEIAWGQALALELGVEGIDEGTTVRQAMLACFERDVFVTAHYGEYMEWLTSAQAEADEEQREDFSPTT